MWVTSMRMCGCCVQASVPTSVEHAESNTARATASSLTSSTSMMARWTSISRRSATAPHEAWATCPHMSALGTRPSSRCHPHLLFPTCSRATWSWWPGLLRWRRIVWETVRPLLLTYCTPRTSLPPCTSIPLWCHPTAPCLATMACSPSRGQGSPSMDTLVLRECLLVTSLPPPRLPWSPNPAPAITCPTAVLSHQIPAAAAGVSCSTCPPLAWAPRPPPPASALPATPTSCPPARPASFCPAPTASTPLTTTTRWLPSTLTAGPWISLHGAGRQTARHAWQPLPTRKVGARPTSSVSTATSWSCCDWTWYVCWVSWCPTLTLRRRGSALTVTLWMTCCRTSSRATRMTMTWCTRLVTLTAPTDTFLSCLDILTALVSSSFEYEEKGSLGT